MTKQVLTRVNAWCARVSGAILALILGVVLYDVVVRSLLNRAQTWTFDFTSYALLFVSFLALARTHEQDGHPRIDLLVNILSSRRKLLAEVFAQVLSLLFVALLLWATWKVTFKVFQNGSVSPSSFSIPLI